MLLFYFEPKGLYMSQVLETSVMTSPATCILAIFILYSVTLLTGKMQLSAVFSNEYKTLEPLTHRTELN